MEDFFGENLIRASHIADEAQGGGIQVSSLLKEIFESAGDIRFEGEQEVALRRLTSLNRMYPGPWI